ncbi:hypothetical protein E8E11_009737 [Didymella keratinophila]|nr:hypothetical protein E8E11_009737 [Didymella keratinophila]
MHARYQSRKSIASAREACRRTTSAQRTSALLPSLLESIPEDPENPTVVRHTGGRDATASDQTEVRQVLYSVLAASVRLASIAIGTHTNTSS